jgi:quercetin dioxygenase-like cupin family protein
MRNTLIIAASFLTLSLPAYAIEASNVVKVTPLLKTQTSWDGKPIEYPKGTAEITGMTVEIAPGSETGWHLHPVPSFGVLLEGELEVTLKTGERKIIKTGEAIAEVINTLHNGRNIGKTPVKILVFYAGSTDLKITEKADAPQSAAPPASSAKIPSQGK